MRIFYKNNQMYITDNTVNKKKPIYDDYRIKNENYAKTNYNWHTGRLFQSRGAAAINDRFPMVTFVKRLGLFRRITLLFRRKS